MARITLARRLADSLQISRTRANRLVDNLGERQARQLAQRAEGGTRTATSGARSGSRLPSNRALGAGAAVGGLGAGGLLWRREGRLEQQAEADRAEAMNQSIEDILANEDLPADVASEMIEIAGLTTVGEYPPDEHGFDLNDLIPSRPDFGGEIMQIVLLLTLAYLLYRIFQSEQGPNISLSGPPADTGAGNGGSSNGS